MERIIRFNTSGYDPFIDFLKAYAIVCVLIGHTIPGRWLNYIAYGLWAGMQVPLFILVQAVHYHKNPKPIDYQKVYYRVVLPFLVVEVITFVILLLGTHRNVIEIFRQFVHFGGYGPGSYFPWVYLQVMLFLPIVGRFLSRVPSKYQLMMVVFICEVLEILASVFNLPDNLYRLLAIRYLFLLYLGYNMVKVGIILNAQNIILSLASLLAIVYFEYFSLNDEPWFFHTEWTFHRWPCYYYVAIIVGGLVAYLQAITAIYNHYVNRQAVGTV